MPLILINSLLYALDARWSVDEKRVFAALSHGKRDQMDEGVLGSIEENASNQRIERDLLPSLRRY